MVFRKNVFPLWMSQVAIINEAFIVGPQHLLSYMYPLNLPLILYHHTFSSAVTSVNHTKQYAYIMCSSDVARKLE